MGKTIFRSLRSQLYITHTEIIFALQANKSFRGFAPLTSWPGALTEPRVWTPLWAQPPPVVVSSSRACHVVPFAEARGVYSTEAWKQPASWQKRGGISREKRKIKLGTYLHYLLYYSLALTCAKIFSLATLARLHFIIQLKMQACNVTSPTPVIFSCIFGVIIPDSHLPKCNKTRLKWHKLHIKCLNTVFGWGSAPDPTTLPRPSTRLGDWIGA